MEKYVGAILLKDYVKFIETKLPKFENQSLVKICVPQEKEQEVYFRYAGHQFRLFHMPMPEDFWFALDRVYVDCKEAYDIAKNMGVKNIDYDFAILAEVKATAPIIENKFEEEIVLSPKVEARLKIDTLKAEPKKEEPKPEPKEEPKVEVRQEVKKVQRGKK